MSDYEVSETFKAAVIPMATSPSMIKTVADVPVMGEAIRMPV